MDRLSPLTSTKRSASNPTIAINGTPNGEALANGDAGGMGSEPALDSEEGRPRGWRVHSFPRSLKEAKQIQEEQPNPIRDRILSMSNILGKVQLGQILITGHHHFFCFKFNFISRFIFYICANIES